jgi:hypothetical protein
LNNKKLSIELSMRLHLIFSHIQESNAEVLENLLEVKNFLSSKGTKGIKGLKDF